MRSYETARSLFNFLAFCAWATVAVGVLAALVGMGTASQYARGGAGLLAGLPGLGITMFGLFLVAIIQNARATVDTAEYTQQMLKVARDQLEVSRQGLRSGFASTPGLGGLEQAEGQSNGSAYRAISEEEVATAGLSPVKETIEYRGAKISWHDEGFIFDGKTFEMLDLAKGYVDECADGEKTANGGKSPAGRISATTVANPADKIEKQKLLRGDTYVAMGMKDGELDYGGEEISVKSGIFYIGELPFSTLQAAQRHIDQMPPKANADPDGPSESL